MKLNLGSGTNSMSGYTNIDINPTYSDDCHDIRDLNYKEGSIEEIVANHMIEHLPFGDALKCLTEWYKWLVPRGILYLSIPDWDVLRGLLDSAANRRTVFDVLFGYRDKSDVMAHKWLMDENGLTGILEGIGFIIGGKFKGMAGSSSFKVNGVPISLNLICKK